MAQYRGASNIKLFSDNSDSDEYYPNLGYNDRKLMDHWYRAVLEISICPRKYNLLILNANLELTFIFS